MYFHIFVDKNFQTPYKIENSGRKYSRPPMHQFGTILDPLQKTPEIFRPPKKTLRIHP